MVYFIDMKFADNAFLNGMVIYGVLIKLRAAGWYVESHIRVREYVLTVRAYINEL